MAADTTTTDLQLVLQVTGNNENTWGVIHNANFAKLEAAEAASHTVTTTGGTTTLSDDQARVREIVVSGTLATNATVQVPDRKKLWVARITATLDSNDNDWTITFKTSGGTGPELRPGDTAVLYCDGTNVHRIGPVISEITGEIDSAVAGLASEAFVRGDTETKTTGFSVTTSHERYLILCDASSAAFTAGLPAAATAGDAFLVGLMKVDSSANAVTIDGDGSETINGAANFQLKAQYDMVWLRSDGSAWHIVGSHLALSTLGAGDAVAYDKASASEVRSAASNKLLTSDLIESASAFVSLTDGDNIALDWDAGVNFTLTLGGDHTLSNPTNGQPGTWRVIEVTQGSGGEHTLSFGNQYYFQGGEPPDLSTGEGAVDILYIFCRTASKFYVSTSIDWKAPS